MKNLNVEIKENKDLGLVVSSRTVAEQLGKRHEHVVNQLKAIISHSQDFGNDIIKSSFTNSKGQTYEEYLLTKKGFNLYMFNIQGYLEYKMAYINEFERMEQALEEQPQLDSYMIDNPLERAKAWIKEEEQRQQLEMTVTELTPKAQYTEQVLQSENLLKPTQIASLYGKSAQWLNRNLALLGVQYNQSGQWFLYAKYKQEGYTKPMTSSKGFESTRWTHKGKQFIVELLEKELDILPIDTKFAEDREYTWSIQTDAKIRKAR